MAFAKNNPPISNIISLFKKLLARSSTIFCVASGINNPAPEDNALKRIATINNIFDGITDFTKLKNSFHGIFCSVFSTISSLL